MKRLFYGLLAAFLMFLPCSGLFAQQKYALVIGNGNYANITRLNNPVNDANDMEAALRGLGFTVEKVLNGNLRQMETGIVNLKNRLKGAKNSYGFFFYAGHGVQSNGENYLIPVDADIQSESFLRRQSISVQEMLDELNEAGNALNMVVLDACRDNPFPWKRSGSRGLQVVGNQPADSIIVFATSAGSTASDGTGRNGLFTGHLLNNLKTPGLEVAEVFRLTMGDVIRASGSQQRPAVYNQFAGLAYLGPRPTPNTSVQPTPQPVTPPQEEKEYVTLTVTPTDIATGWAFGRDVKIILREVQYDRGWVLVEIIVNSSRESLPPTRLKGRDFKEIGNYIINVEKIERDSAEFRIVRRQQR